MSTRNSFFLAIFVPLLASSQFLDAQRPYYFNWLNTNSGLSSNQENTFIHQDRLGYTWISSTVGLNRFDGFRTITYHSDPDNPHSISAEVGMESYPIELANGDLIFGGRNALTRYNRSTDDFDNFNHPNLAGDTIRKYYYWCHLSSDEETVFFSANWYLFKSSINNLQHAEIVDTVLIANRDQLIAEVDPGTFTILRPRLGVDLLRLRHYVNFSFSPPEEHKRTPDGSAIFDTYAEDAENIWLATNSGGWHYNMLKDIWTKIAASGSRTLPATSSVDITANGDPIFGTNNKGIYVVDKSTKTIREPLFRHFANEVVVSDFEITDGYVSQDNTYWISTKTNGVYFVQLNEPKFDYLDLRPVSAGDAVISIHADAKLGLHILTDSAVIGLTLGDTLVYPLPPEAFGFGRPNDIYVDNERRIWVSTFRYLFVLKENSKSFERFDQHPEPAPSFSTGYSGVREFFDSILTVTTYNGAVYTISKDLQDFKWWPLNTEGIISATETPQGYLLFGTTYDSLFITENPPSLSNILYQDKINGQVTKAHYDENRNCFWVGTLNGLYAIKETTNGEWVITRVFADLIHSVATMEFTGNHLWFASNAKVGCLDLNSDEISWFTISDGIQGAEHAVRASTKSMDGNIYFGGPNGVTVINGHPRNLEVQNPRCLIPGILINDEPYPSASSSSFNLPYDSNNIRILLATGEYSDRSQVEFRYTIADRATVKRPAAFSEPFIKLESLQPQHYEIDICASNADGVWSENSCRIQITIRPPWYQTTLAYLLYTLTIAGTLGGLLYFRYRQLRRVELAQLSKAEAERVAAETETSVLRLQMNPHFIFNSLNSIDDYILDQNPLEAHDYLVVFADLMRDILNRSTQPLTRLDREIELLQRYVEAERRRVGEGLRLHIDVADNLDDVSTYLPTMILQPFVENAIWHGIGHRPEGGTVTLRFYEQDGLLVAEVEDNGIGRRRAGANSGDKKHGSKALEITERRLTLLRSQFTPEASSALLRPTHPAPASAQKKIGYEVQDLQDESGTPTGTRVILYLPLTYPGNDARPGD